MEAKVHSIETFGSLDGPGIRFIIFLKGCNMRCLYCHNPDTWANNVYEIYTSDELIDKALRYKEYWGDKGGITVSGGEPLLQIDFLIELFKKCKNLGINTCIDTSGSPFSKDKETIKKFDKLMKYTDLVLLDIKHIDPIMHKKLTGKDNKNIIEFFYYLNSIKKPIWIRHVLLKDYTDIDKYLIETRKFIDTLSNVERIDILPFHQLGKYKYEKLNIPYLLKDYDTPTEDRIKNAEKILKE